MYNLSVRFCKLITRQSCPLLVIINFPTLIFLKIIHIRWQQNKREKNIATVSRSLIEFCRTPMQQPDNEVNETIYAYLNLFLCKGCVSRVQSNHTGQRFSKLPILPLCDKSIEKSRARALRNDFSHNYWHCLTREKKNGEAKIQHQSEGIYRNNGSHVDSYKCPRELLWKLKTRRCDR